MHHAVLRASHVSLFTGMYRR